MCLWAAFRAQLYLVLVVYLNPRLINRVPFLNSAKQRTHHTATNQHYITRQALTSQYNSINYNFTISKKGTTKMPEYTNHHMIHLQLVITCEFLV